DHDFRSSAQRRTQRLRTHYRPSPIMAIDFDARASLGPSRPINVLVVDDSAVMRQVMTTVLSRDGLLVDTAAHPLIAQGKMKQKRPDVIVLDIEMPHVDVLTFLQQIMAQEPIPVLVCSALAKGGADTVMRALEYGAVD